MTQSFSKIWIIGILAVILAGGFFAWQYWAPKPAPADETGNYGDYKSYVDNERGYTVDYPPWYSYEKTMGGVYFFDAKDSQNMGIEIVGSASNQGSNFKDLTSLFPDQTPKEITIGGKKAYLYLASYGQKQRTAFYFLFSDDNLLLTIQATLTEYGSLSSEKQLIILNQMLSTFRFLPPR